MKEDPSAEVAVVDADGIEKFVAEMVRCLEWQLVVRAKSGEEGSILVELSGEDRDLVLQNRAELLEVFQYLLNRMFGNGPTRVVVDCDGYRARKEAELREIALRVSERVRRTGLEEELGLMNPYERRIVHLAVADAEGVTTESEGDGLMKRVVILPA